MNRRSCLLWAILVVTLAALALVVFMLGVLARPPTPRPAAAFFAARDTWTRRPFTHYRLVVEQEGALQPRCRQEIEVRDEQIVDVVENSCASNVMTVSGMFARIEQYTTEVVCGPNGCDCDGRIVARATYDPQLGYPQSLVIELQTPQRPFWSFFSRQSCTLIGWSGFPSMQVVTLTPLP